MAASDNLNPVQFERHDPRHWGLDQPADVHPSDQFKVEYVGYRRVNLGSAPIVAGEPRINAEFVDHLVKHPRARGSGDGGKMLVEHEGRLHLWDGNHRTAAAKARGQQHAYFDYYRTKPL